jgi:type VI protein secretion system component VasF
MMQDRSVHRPDHVPDQPPPEEMVLLYPALAEYLTVFDPEKSKRFRPLQAEDGGEAARRTEKRRPFPWGILFAVLCAAALIIYIVVTTITGMPEIS